MDETASSSSGETKKNDGKALTPETDLVAYLQLVQSCVQPLTRSAAHLPGPSDLPFHRSLDRSLARALDVAKDDILHSINDLMTFVSDSSADKEEKVTIEDVVDAGKFERKFGDVVDTLLERTDMRLDEYTGKAPVREDRRSTNARSSLRQGTTSTATTGPLPPHILNAPIKPLPQAKFTRKANNARDQIWTHSLVEKPHARKFDDEDIATSANDGSAMRGTRRGMYCAEGDPRDNPYFNEITHFTPPEHAFKVPSMDSLELPPPLLQEEPDGGPTPFLWVDDEATFTTLYEHLKEDRVKEVAIDVEHHNFRSYQGLVCLVQISTRWHDFILDALSPTVRDIAFRLNDVFADPDKVKVLHGAEHDVLWLQRDLNLYIVGLFDTFHATNVLQFSQHGLAFLLQRYIDFIADKRYQLADWRIRPLPKEMLYYARSDTHSLLYVYDCMRFEISQQRDSKAIATVFEQSKRTAAKTYAKEVWGDDSESREGWRAMWQRLGGTEATTTDVRFEKEGLDGLTMTERLFRSLHDWRDQVARKEDESPRYILNSANLLNLSSRAPQTREGILACIGTGLKKRSNELMKLITEEAKQFDEAQIRKAQRQKELIEKAAVGELDDEEMGEVVERSNSLSSSLFPPQVHVSPAIGTTRASPLASMLFATPTSADVDEHASQQKSLFAPASKKASSQKLLQSIRSDFADALGSILAFQPADQPKDGGQEVVVHTPPVPMKVSSPVEPEASSTMIDPAAKDEPVETEKEEEIVQVKKKRSRKETSEATSAREEEAELTEKSQKRRWTKEEKAERRRQEQERLAAVVPFDYANATSVLDAAPSSSSPATPRDKKADRKDRSKAANGGGSGEKGRKESAKKGGGASTGRYANVPAGRDRREQAGGKSMTFSR